MKSIWTLRETSMRLAHAFLLAIPLATTLLASSSLTTTAAAETIGSGPVPITYQPSSPAFLTAEGAIEITGTVAGSTPATLVLRVDDTWGAAYADRVNLERTQPPGPFTWRITAPELRTSGGRALNLTTIRQVVLFAATGGPVDISTFRSTGGSPPAQQTPPPPIAAPAIQPQREAAGLTSLGPGPLPITYQPSSPAFLTAEGAIEITGTVAGSTPATLVLRVDDTWGAAYADRVNLERTLSPGPFSWRITAPELRTSGGRALNLTTIRQVVLFAATGGPVEITAFTAASTAGAIVPPQSTPPPPALAPTSAPPAAPQADPKPADTKPSSARGPRPPLALGTGKAPIKHEPWNSFDGSGRELVISGTNTGRAAQSIVIRIDDSQSTGYPSRVNVERTLPPGPFDLRLGVDGLRTPNGRTIDARNLRRVILAPWPETSTIDITKFEFADIPTLPDGARGYALGAAEATLPPGFERIAPSDSRLNGPAIAPRRRSKPDSLVANGLDGLSRIRLAAPAGRARVTIWSEDPGEWEYLPMVQRRSIRVNGVLVVDERNTPQEWLARRYLRGLWREHDRASDAWTAYGMLRGDRRSVEVDVGSAGIEIEIDGDSPKSRFVSAVLVEPATGSRALEQVEADRATWYRSNWRLSPEPARPVSADTYQLVLSAGTPSTEPSAPLSAKAAPGTGVRLTLEVTSDAGIATPKVQVVEPRRSGTSGAALTVDVWAGLWRLAPLLPFDTTLTLNDDQLMRDVSRLPLHGSATASPPALPRRYELWIDVPQAAAPGRYSGALRIGGAEILREIPIEIDVLPVTLPPIAKPVGFYLGYPPNLSWAGATRLDRERQARCDLALMTKLGLNGTAPPVSAPLKERFDQLIGELQSALSAGVAPGFLLYDPLREARTAVGVERTGKIAAGAMAALKARKVAPPLWTGADEPSNPEQFTNGVEAWVRAIRTAAPGIRLAGHLNNPSDIKVADLFDVLIVNDGFGIDAATTRRYTDAGKIVWIYNTFEPRLTAGVWLAHTAAARYVQWHARMPTADPFDPIDGRESDVQVILPSASVCEAPNIHRDLLRLAEGAVDQRWLSWLDTRREPEAMKLAADLRRRFGGVWADARKLGEAELVRTRSAIVELAGRLTTKQR